MPDRGGNDGAPRSPAAAAKVPFIARDQGWICSPGQAGRGEASAVMNAWGAAMAPPSGSEVEVGVGLRAVSSKPGPVQLRVTLHEFSWLGLSDTCQRRSWLEPSLPSSVAPGRQPAAHPAPDGRHVHPFGIEWLWWLCSPCSPSCNPRASVAGVAGVRDSNHPSCPSGPAQRPKPTEATQTADRPLASRQALRAWLAQSARLMATPPASLGLAELGPIDLGGARLGRVVSLSVCLSAACGLWASLGVAGAAPTPAFSWTICLARDPWG